MLISPVLEDDALTMSGTSGKYAGFVPLESLDPEARKLVEMLQHQIELLREKLKESSPESGEKAYTLEEAQAGLADAAARLMNGDEGAQADFDKWDKVICEHPDQLAKLAQERVEWEEAQTGENNAALAITRGYVPENIKSSSVATLVTSGLPTNLAKRVFTQKALWLVRLPQSQIAKLHIVDLKTKYSTQGLDLIELRAIYNSLPIEFENDPSGEKQQWRETLRSKLEACVKEDVKGKLKSCRFRHPYYIDAESCKPVSMPFWRENDSTLQEYRANVDALQERAAKCVKKPSKPKLSTIPSNARQGAMKLQLKQNLAAMLASKKAAGPPASRRPVKPVAKSPGVSAAHFENALLKRSKPGIPPAHVSRPAEAQRPSSGSSRSPCSTPKPTRSNRGKFEDRIAKFETKLFTSLKPKEVEMRVESAKHVKKLDIPDDFRKKLVTLRSSNPKEAPANRVEKEWAQVATSGKDAEAQQIDETNEAADDFEWQALEKSLCLQERPLTEQVNMLERLLHVLLSTSLYGKRRSSEHGVPMARTHSGLSDSVEVLVECGTSPLTFSVRDKVNLVTVDTPVVQKTLDNLKNVFSKSLTTLGIPQSDDPPNETKSRPCAVVLENSKDADWLIVNKN